MLTYFWVRQNVATDTPTNVSASAPTIVQTNASTNAPTDAPTNVLIDCRRIGWYISYIDILLWIAEMSYIGIAIKARLLTSERCNPH